MLKDKIQYIAPELQPTLEADMKAIKDKITAWRFANPNRRRAEYIAAIQPLKNQLVQKRAQNELIIANNNALLQKAQSDYQTALASKQADVDALENAIKTYVDSIKENL
jgi:hypothetical protein